MKLFISLVVLAAVICSAFAQPRPNAEAVETLESVDGGVGVDADSGLTRKVRGFGGFGGFYPRYGRGFYPGGYGGYGGYPGFGGGFGGGSSYAQASAGASGFGGGFYGR